MKKNILVAYATGSGSTKEIAEAIGAELAADGVEIFVENVKNLENVEAFSAIVLGSSIRVGQWLPEAVSFLKQNHEQMSKVPVAYFTTCLTMADGTEDATKTVLAYLEPLLALTPDVHPVGLGLFAGSLAPSMERRFGEPFGDFRDWNAIRAWAREIRPALFAGSGPVTSTVVMSHAFVNLKGEKASAMAHQAMGQEASQTPEPVTMQSTKSTSIDQREADLQNVDFQGKTLSGAHFGWADLTGAQLQKSDLTQANLIGATLKDTDLTDAKMTHSVLNGVILANANLVGADLEFADMNWVDFRGANLEGANLNGASLGWANLQGVDLSETSLEGALYNLQTQWPDDFDPEEAGCVLKASY